MFLSTVPFFLEAFVFTERQAYVKMWIWNNIYGEDVPEEIGLASRKESFSFKVSTQKNSQAKRKGREKTWEDKWKEIK